LPSLSRRPPASRRPRHAFRSYDAARLAHRADAAPTLGCGGLANGLVVTLDTANRRLQAVDDLRLLDRIPLPYGFGIGKALA
jgi:hypothetical protein